MWVVSKLGQGSAFHFTIPSAVPIPLANTDLTAHALHRREVGALVVVERSPLVSRLLKRYLAGIDVTQVASLNELRDAARTILPEAVIVNEPFGGLPGADGVAGRVETHPGVPLPRRWADRADRRQGRRRGRRRAGPHGGEPVQTGDARAPVCRHL